MPVVRRRLWLVEDSDGPLLQCSDQTLAHCDELSSAGWLALLVTLRPSALAYATPPPELDVPDVRSDKRPAMALGGADAADTPAGTLDPWLGKKSDRALPHMPSKADAAKAAHALDARGKPCLGEIDKATLDVIWNGDGHLISLLVDTLGADDPMAKCFQLVARKMDFPRFAGTTFRMHTLVMKRAR
jgi:hypothetical protein